MPSLFECFGQVCAQIACPYDADAQVLHVNAKLCQCYAKVQMCVPISAIHVWEMIKISIGLDLETP
jgi:hypothetical protein